MVLKLRESLIVPPKADQSHAVLLVISASRMLSRQTVYPLHSWRCCFKELTGAVIDNYISGLITYYLTLCQVSLLTGHPIPRLPGTPGRIVTTA